MAPFEVPPAKTGASFLSKTKGVLPLGRVIVRVDRRNVRALLLRFWLFYQIPLPQDFLNIENFLDYDILHFRLWITENRHVHQINFPPRIGVLR